MTTACSGDGDVAVGTSCRDPDDTVDSGSESIRELTAEADSDECLSIFDVEDGSCEEDDEKREDGERIARVEMMLDSSAKVIDRLTSQLKVGHFHTLFLCLL